MILFLQDIFIMAIFTGIVVWYSRISTSAALRSLRSSAEVHENFKDALKSEHFRSTRQHFLFVCDHIQATRLQRPMLGLAFLVPQDVLNNPAPIDVSRYYTSEEIEAIRTGIEIFALDKRTEDIRHQFTHL